MNTQTYGLLYGKLELQYDIDHDEVFIPSDGLIVMRNKVWLYRPEELWAIVKERCDSDGIR